MIGDSVYKLRLKVAEPGGAPSPPPTASASQSKGKATANAQKSDKPASDTREADYGDSDSESDIASDSEEEPSPPDFNPGVCLFCNLDSSTLEANISHMSTAHGFTIPFQDFLAVDLETVVYYLHFIIASYRECISCGTRRSTIEGIQQHMIAKGHCRFDISPETEEFYEMPKTENEAVEKMQRDGGVPVRLPSGKLIAQRKNPEVHEPRAPRRAAPDRPLPSNSEAPEAPGMEVADRRGNRSGEVVRSNEAILAAQLSRLRVAGDRAQYKEVARRRWRVERGQNIISLKRFKLDSADSRMGRQF